MADQAVDWIGRNWISILGIAVAVWISYRLRPHPSLSIYKKAGVAATGTVTMLPFDSTTIILKNTGTDTIEPELFRTPLRLGFAVPCHEVTVSRVSHSDIGVDASAAEDNPRIVNLSLNHLEPGDAVELVIRHQSTRILPQVAGTLRGNRRAIKERLTGASLFLQNGGAILSEAAQNYITLLSLFWLLMALVQGSFPWAFLFLLAAFGDDFFWLASFGVHGPKVGAAKNEHYNKLSADQRVVFLQNISHFAAMVKWLFAGLAAGAAYFILDLPILSTQVGIWALVWAIPVSLLRMKAGKVRAALDLATPTLIVAGIVWSWPAVGVAFVVVGDMLARSATAAAVTRRGKWVNPTSA